MPKIPVLLDTDIGSDIDDALCLSYLLKQERCELLGITTVSGEAQKRAMLASALCRLEDKGDIPIHSGADNPLWGKQRQPRAQQAIVLPNWNHHRDFQANTAVEFLRHTIRKRPHEITLLTIGPLTNIALLFRLDPEIPKLLKGLVMMIGAFGVSKGFTNPPLEWNSLLDPWASAIVYDAIEDTPNLSVGLDVTEKCFIPAEKCREIIKGGSLDLVREAAEVWFEGSDRITFHDPLAAAVLFKPELIERRLGTIQVEVNGDSAGQTRWEGAGEKHEIAFNVDSAGFFQEFFSLF